MIERITKTTGKLEDVWRVVEDYYRVTLSSDTFLELAKMSKNKTETYRQFYMRMEGFVSKHLTKGNVKVEDVTSPAVGDSLIISLKNVIVIIWMSKIHQKLVDFVKVDFAQELKAGNELIELMCRVADNVDNIFARHDAAAGVSLLIGDEETGGNMHHKESGNVFRTEGTSNFQRGQGRSSSWGRGQKPEARVAKPQAPGKTLHCGHCKCLSETLKLRINTNHEPTECYRKDIAVRLVEGEDTSADNYSSAEDIGQHSAVTTSSSNFCPFPE